jgi:WD40 repeat protein
VAVGVVVLSESWRHEDATPVGPYAPAAAGLIFVAVGSLWAGVGYRTAVVAVGVALVVALIGGFIALDQRREAERERRVATARELAAAADANLDDDPERSVLLALAAIDQTRSSDGIVLPEAEEALHRAVTASRILLSAPGVGGALDWSPDGTLFVTEGPEDTGLIDIRDADTGESVRSFHGHDVDVNSVAFSNDGSMLATAGDDGAVRVWDPGTGDELLEVQRQDDDGGGVTLVTGPSFSPDGARVAAAWRDVVRVIDIATGEVVTEIAADDPSSTDFSRDGARLAIASWSGDAMATVVDASSGEEHFTLRGNESGTNDVDWSPDGKWIATAGADGTARIWDADTGKHRFLITGHTAYIWSLDWSPDATRLATVSDDGTARISEISDGGVRELLSFSAQDTSHGLNGVAFSPDGERLMTGDLAITAVKIWDTSDTGGAEWMNMADVPWGGNAADFTPDSRALVMGGFEGAASISDIKSGNRVATFGARSGDGEVAWTDLSNDGQLLATAEWDGPVDVWEASTEEHRLTVGADSVDGWVGEVEWSRDSQVLAIVFNYSDRSDVVIVDRSGAELATITEAAGNLISSVSFSPDGRLLATTREGIERVDPSQMNATIWDWRRGEIVRTIETSANLVVFDPTGTRIATARRVEGVADVWDARTGDRVATLAAASLISDITFDPDGTSVATTHADGTIRLWNPDTGVQQLMLGGPATLAEDVKFSPDGTKLATTGSDAVVRVWALDLDDLIAIANARLTRTLSDDECRQYLHVERCPQP